MIKYTKTELRTRQIKLTQLCRYLPTLQLKKALLQLEVDSAANELEKLMIQLSEHAEKISRCAKLFLSKEAHFLFEALDPFEVKSHHENIAGVDLPLFEEVVFPLPSYALFDSPIWLDSAILQMRELIETREKGHLVRKKKALLEKELSEVSIRVNLFEKIMIPRTKDHIKKIKIFLGDQQLAAVSQAKVAKRKILERKMEKALS